MVFEVVAVSEQTTSRCRSTVISLKRTRAEADALRYRWQARGAFDRQWPGLQAWADSRPSLGRR